MFLYSASRYFKVLIQEMDVKVDMGFLMALIGLFSSDTIDRSQEVTNIIALLIFNPCCTACSYNNYNIYNSSRTQHIYIYIYIFFFFSFILVHGSISLQF